MYKYAYYILKICILCIGNMHIMYQKHSIFINEGGLYSLILKSNKKIAVDFQRWITHEVLPSIRKNSYYTLEQKYKHKMQHLYTQLVDKQSRIKQLENNQKKY